MKPYAAYAIGAALVDTEIQVTDAELATMNVEKGMMTLVDQARQGDILTTLSDHLIRANHASGGSAGNSMIATAMMGAPTYMSCKVAEDADGDSGGTMPQGSMPRERERASTTPSLTRVTTSPPPS